MENACDQAYADGSGESSRTSRDRERYFDRGGIRGSRRRNGKARISRKKGDKKIFLKKSVEFGVRQLYVYTGAGNNEVRWFGYAGLWYSKVTINRKKQKQKGTC